MIKKLVPTNEAYTRTVTCIIKCIGILLGMAFLCFIVYKVLERPHYTILPIPSPLSHLPRGDWDTTEYITQYWSDSDALVFIWRRETRAYTISEDPQYGYETWEAVVSYFNDWLTSNGWVRSQVLIPGPCASYLSESKFLPHGENGYVTYRRPGVDISVADETVCLAVWPVLTNGVVSSYRIVLLTATPSFFTEWNSRWLLSR